MEQAKISGSQGGMSLAHATHSKPAAAAADSSQTAGVGGFMALLAAMGDAAMEVDVGIEQNFGGAQADVAESGDATLLALAPTPGDAGAAAAWQGLLAAAAGGVGLPVVTGAVQGVVSDAVVGGLGSGRSLGMVAETALMDGAGDLVDGALVSPMAGAGRAFSRLQGALAQRLVSTTDLAQARAGGAERQQPLSSHVASIAQVQPGMVATMAVALPVAAQRGAEGSALQTQGLSVVSLAGAQADPSVAAGAIGGVTSAARSSEGALDQGLWSQSGETMSAPRESASVDSTAGMPDPGQFAAEEQLAEQVTYWVNQKTQNAELTLHRDGQAVEVSVSLSGQEAHVTFLCDQEQTRELLDRSMAQLSDMLRGEGLVLSGMSVGTSADRNSGGAGTEQPRGREEGRKTQVTAATSAVAAPSQRGGRVGEGAVDIFV